MSVNTTLTGAEIRARFLDFFVSKGHVKVPSSSLVPHNDPTVLLTTAGMQQMIPYFLGRETPPATRLTSAQKCFRTTDIDIVGNQRTLTFFEMLGNFSVGDYFKREAITFAWEFLTKVLGLPADKLYPTVHPEDDEAPAIWTEVSGIPDETIVRLEDNWWGPPGASGPCGPDSEIYYDRGPEHGCGRPDCKPGCDCERFLEIWNLVFMQYYQDFDGTREPLPRKNIDTGMGLERLTMVLQGRESVFETDLYRPIIDHFAGLTGTEYGKDPKTDVSLRVIADHARALVFLAADGVLPSNEGRGYIFRRVLRRAVRHGKLLGLDKPFLSIAADTVINLLGDYYTELRQKRDRIVEVLSMEEKKFSQTLNTGLQLLNELLTELNKKQERVIPGEQVFKLYDTHGFPVELTQEIAAEQGFTIDTAGFEEAMQRQQERSRAASQFVQKQDDRVLTEILQRHGPTEFTGYQGVAGNGKVLALVVDSQEAEDISAPQQALLILDSTPFYAESGGQIGDRGTIQGPMGLFEVQDTRRPIKGLIVHYGKLTEGHLRVGDEVQASVIGDRREDTMRNHSATHLLHKALRDLLGPQVEQRGSLVEPERLRFDFSSPRPLTPSEIAQVDAQVNRWIRADYPVHINVMPLQEAMQTGAMALFGEKYDDVVRVVSMGSSKELCGGTHCASTGQIGIFVTVQEGSVAAGVRRIEALTGRAAEAYLRQRSALVDTLATKLQVQPDKLEARIELLQQDLAAARRQIEQYQREAAQQQAETLASRAQDVSGVPVVAAVAQVANDKVLREMGDMVRAKLNQPAVVVVAAAFGERVAIQASVDPVLTKRGLHAGKLAAAVGQRLGGKGGGRPDSAQGGGKNKAEMGAALDLVPVLVKENLK
ncbi:alanyl-tRNA synthetase [Thermosporothrix hazakensis]|uniref:Alanine--tRNA ligase n=1 Tax=Thermosporothrix hazakensis TaxID=644383 RepID=A0A326U3H7_THEHA|nr:alanine--tRNA ligase [Thermosporothrix hazakensis]PZW26639.1 alanyl-tRNA synthetase [Thermosporothrix hazakensis]GCE47659.1 alanine--tRNA ligase [Thermosporothrix hazakensis]